MRLCALRLCASMLSSARLTLLPMLSPRPTRHSSVSPLTRRAARLLRSSGGGSSPFAGRRTSWPRSGSGRLRLT
ncbi:hypothetical protein DMC30DRAFT_405735 [Rhodotorula diobovata]|uniref:Secreted protein n=1 Tax=Rhodotorula diobovata TaxID=5288 RepID=A0A5C5FNE0_9BASI|nr:hypothetical protein DMC30DRAFT_405735 [Rhodotorula diobovata]